MRDPFRKRMKIRLAQSEDASAVLKTHVAAVRGLCVEDYTREQIEAWVGWKEPKDYMNPILERRLFVAEIAGNVTGFGEYEDERINAVYVDPAFARKGIGTALFHRLVSELAARGVGRATLSASLSSVSFYSAMGCIRGLRQSHCLRAGVEIPCVAMTFEIETKANKTQGGNGVKTHGHRDNP